MIKIFSDESGSWTNKKDYYIRSWIKIRKNDYDNLIKEILEKHRGKFSVSCYNYK